MLSRRMVTPCIANSNDFNLSSFMAAPEKETAFGAGGIGGVGTASASASATRSLSAISMAFVRLRCVLEQPRSIALW